MEKVYGLLMSLVVVVLATISFFSFSMASEKMSLYSVSNVEESREEEMPHLLVSGARISEQSPCSKCHVFRPVDSKKRKLELFHGEIVLKHAGERQWCYDCHDGDGLRLQGGGTIGFEKSYDLCGQCHGTIFRDWKAGIHGKRTGRWDGDKLYRLCVSCHDPHQPAFKPLAPMGAPVPPHQIKSDKG